MKTTIKNVNGEEITLSDPKVYIVYGRAGIGKTTLLKTMKDDNIRICDFCKITPMFVVKMLHETNIVIFETNTKDEITKLIDILSMYDIIPNMIEFKTLGDYNGKHE